MLYMSNYFSVTPVTHHFAHASKLTGEFQLGNCVFNSNSLVYKRVCKMVCVIKTALNLNPAHFPKLTLSIGFKSNYQIITCNSQTCTQRKRERESKHWILLFFWLNYFVPSISQYDL